MSSAAAARGSNAPGASPVRAWLIAARPQTLAAGVSPVLLGTALAAAEDRDRLGLALIATLTALLLQLGSNFANDLLDFERGADTAERIGPTRAVAGGLLSPAQMRWGTLLVFGAAAACGAVLVLAGGWPFALLGTASLAAAWLYTGGPWPLAYHGLGEAAVFVFFGLVAAAGSYALQAQEVTLRAVLVALPSACLVTAILVVNNLRDVDTDARAGKRTLAVRIGRRATRIQYVVLVALAYAGLAVLVAGRVLELPALLPFLTLGFVPSPLRAVLQRSDGAALNAALVRTARIHAAFTLLLAVGVLA